MNKYREYLKKVKEDINNFPMFFAFSKDQLYVGMAKLGVKSLEDLCSISAGGFIRKTDAKAYMDMNKRHSDEIRQSIATDDTFVYQMFMYEMNNHEYCFTGDIGEVLSACCISNQEFANNSRLQNIFMKAESKYLDSVDE